MKITLKLPSGKTISRSFKMNVVSIGRSKSSDFTVQDESLSRVHCLIEISNSEFFITDLKSSNGVYLDNLRILPNKRVPFTTFIPLSIGQLECHVADEENPFAETLTAISRPPLSEKKSHSIVRGPKKTAKNDNDRFIKYRAYIISGAVLIIAIYFNIFLVTNDKIAKQDMAPLDKNVPAQFLEIKDNFLSHKHYESIKQETSCMDAKTCKELNLSRSKHEGYKKSRKEVYIYASENKAQKTKKPELTLLYHLFKSKTFEDFQEKKTAQIHLLLMDDEAKKIIKAYRFHTKYYTNNERFRLLSEITFALESGATSQFWEYARPLIQIQDYNH